MLKSKIYLAKSNRANPNIVSAIRSRLSEYKVEVVEYTGGAFSHKEMLKCEVLIVLPDLHGIVGQAWEVTLGKGLHEQISTWRSKNPNECDLLFVSQYQSEEIMISGFDDFDFADTDDYINYSVALLGEQIGTLRNALENRFDRVHTEHSSTTINSEYSYLLIGK